MSVIDIVEERLTEECVVLEEIAGALVGSGTLQQRLDQALDLLRDRLQVVRARLAPREGEADEPEVHTFTEPLTLLHPSLVGQSDAMGQVYQAIRRVSDSQATVLLRGESGTGKELVAKAIHLEGPKAKGPFVQLHCAAVTETLLESELFGHERGAFTGAVDTRKGRFELADGGTLFLDEIGDIPPRHAGEAASRPAGQVLRTGGRKPALDGRRARDFCHAPRPGSDGVGGILQGGPLLPPQCRADHAAAVARARRGCPAAD